MKYVLALLLLVIGSFYSHAKEHSSGRIEGALALADFSNDSRMLDNSEISVLTGGICQSPAVAECGGSEELATHRVYKQWWVKYKPIVVFSNFCASYTDDYIISKNEFRRTTSFEIGRAANGVCTSLTRFTPPENNQVVTVDLVSFLMDKKDDIERKSAQGIEFSRCDAINKVKLVNVKVHSTSIKLSDSNDLIYEVNIFEDGSDELSTLHYTYGTEEEVCR